MFKHFDKSTFTSYFLIFTFLALVIYRFYFQLDSGIAIDIPIIKNSFLAKKWILVSLFSVSVIYIAIRLNLIIVSLKLFSKNNNLCLFIFFFMTSLWLVKKPCFTDLLILIQSYYCIELFNNSIQQHNTIENYFKMGVILSTLALLTPINILFLIPFIISFTIIGKNGIRDLLSLIVGILLPIYIFIAYHILVGNISEVNSYFFLFKNFKFQLIANYEIYVACIFIFSILIALPKITSLNIHTRMLLSSIFPITFIVTLFMISFIFMDCKMTSAMTVITTIYATIFLNLMKNKRQRDILIILCIILGIINIFVL